MRLVISGSSASGVTSRGVTPVPPVTTTTSTAGSSIQARSWLRIASRLSLTSARATTSWPASRKRSIAVCPERSSSSVRVSDTVRTASLTAMNSLEELDDKVDQPPLHVDLALDRLTAEERLHLLVGLGRRDDVGVAGVGGDLDGAAHLAADLDRDCDRVALELLLVVL